MAAIFGYINVRFLKLPNSIGLMFITIVFTLAVFGLSFVNDTLFKFEKSIVDQIDFETVLLNIMLSFLLFAGALHTNFEELKLQRWPVLAFATIGTLVSTFLVGTAMFFLFQITNLNIDYIYCLLFGALISPTDPIAVLGILKKAKVQKSLETRIVGESLFNDGVGVVIFLTIFKIAEGGGSANVNPLEVLALFGQEVVGGIGLGLFLGWITYRLMKSIDDYDIEVIITLATVMVGTLIAEKLHVSAPLAMVTAGLIAGSQKIRASTMSKTTESYVDKFWELLDILLNTILFVLIGMELLVLEFNMAYVISGLVAIPVLLACRYASLVLPIDFFNRKLEFIPNTNLIMTWGGLRGGISIALALSLQEGMHRELFLAITYIIVVFSIIVQGLTVGKLVESLKKRSGLTKSDSEKLHTKS